DVFGQVEITGPGVECRLGDQWIEMVAEGRNYGLLALTKLGQSLWIGRVDLGRFDTTLAGDPIQRLAALVGYRQAIIAGAGEEFSDHPADLAGAQQQHAMHAVPSLSRVFALKGPQTQPGRGQNSANAANRKGRPRRVAWSGWNR